MIQGKNWYTLDGKIIDGSEEIWAERYVELYEFEEDGTGIYGNGSNLNSVDTWPITWKIKGDQLIVTDPVYGDKDTSTIKSITDNQFVQSYINPRENDDDESTDQYPGQMYNSLITYKRVDSTPR